MDTSYMYMAMYMYIQDTEMRENPNQAADISQMKKKADRSQATIWEHVHERKRLYTDTNLTEIYFEGDTLPWGIHVSPAPLIKFNEVEWRIYASVNYPSLVQIILCRLQYH